MRIDQAIAAAKRAAKRTDREYFVVRADDDTGFDYCDEFDMETFYAFQGCEYVVYPDGVVER